jgi:cysteinyl-tRNA synthetase
VLFDLATELNRSRDPATERLLRSLAGVLGLLGRNAALVKHSGLRGSEDAAVAGLDDAAIAALIAQRASAKQAKQYAQADRIRADLLAQGVVLEDSASGTTWRRG